MPRKLTIEEINDRLEGRGIKFVDVEYVNDCHKHTFQCGYNHTWESTSSNILQGSGCPICSGNNKPTIEEIHSKLLEDGRGIRFLDEYYVNANHKYNFQCKHDHQWKTSITHVLHKGSGCPTCAKQQTTSKQHRNVEKWLLDNNIRIRDEQKFDQLRGVGDRMLSYDFVVIHPTKPRFLVFIEVNGMQHYKPIDYFGGEGVFFKQQKHDQLKRDYVKRKPHIADMLEIRYDEDEIEALEKYFNN